MTDPDPEYLPDPRAEPRMLPALPADMTAGPADVVPAETSYEIALDDSPPSVPVQVDVAIPQPGN